VIGWRGFVPRKLFYVGRAAVPRLAAMPLAALQSGLAALPFERYVYLCIATVGNTLMDRIGLPGEAMEQRRAGLP